MFVYEIRRVSLGEESKCQEWSIIPLWLPNKSVTTMSTEGQGELLKKSSIEYLHW